jgi:hypothetical protein
VATLSIGIVTGANKFFIINDGILQEFPEWVASFPNTGTTIFARSFFDRIESCTESITRIRFVRSRAFGIQREEFRNYKIGVRHAL